MNTEINSEFDLILKNPNFCSVRAEVSEKDKIWCVSTIIMINGFSATTVTEICSGKAGKQQAEKIASVINKHNDNYSIMKDALSFCLPDMCDVDEKTLSDQQLFTLNKVKEILNEDEN